ncbi:Transposase, Ptta/En/Spm, plant [Corchorus olitorius]|uniref:Transposase, Ptta/En/Spm, plant n=1 Tax=Corchorus olitorius TaxID=93759 RepID=A0A1R3GUR1_9ROSI|nr:Transposase, Ptta/En/Spm, plant [Corchorus olitorius]
MRSFMPSHKAIGKVHGLLGSWFVFYTFPIERAKAIRKEFGSRIGKQIRKAFVLARQVPQIPPLRWVPEAAWEVLRAYWRSREFKEKSERNKNRASEQDLSLYGFKTVKLGREPFDHELFARIHGLKDKTFPEGRARTIAENFDAALRAAEDQAAGNLTALAAIDKNALFAQHAGGSKGRQLGRGNLVHAKRCGVVDPTAALTASQPSSIGLNQPNETNQNQDLAEETHEDEAEAENDEGEEKEGDR